MSWVSTARNAWISLQVNTRSFPSTLLSHPWDPQSFSDTPILHLQKSLSDIIHNMSYQTLISSASERDLIRLQSCSGTGAGAFLSALPYERGSSFSNAEIDLALRFRLGLPLPGLSHQCVCATTPDEIGDHYMCCNFGGDLQVRHDWIKQVFSSILKSAGSSVQCEVPISAFDPNQPSLVNRRFDLLARTGAHSPLSADVSIVHPTPCSAASRRTYSRQAGTAARIREELKSNAYTGISRRLGMVFTPLIFESFGRCGTKCERFLKTLARHVASRESFSGTASPHTSALLLHSWRRRISCALQKANARIFQMRAFRGAAGPTSNYSDSVDFGDLRLPRFNF